MLSDNDTNWNILNDGIKQDQVWEILITESRPGHGS